MKTLSKTLIALGLLANAQVLIADEVKNQCLSEDGQVLTGQAQNTEGDCLYGFQWHLSGKAFGRGESHNEFNTNSSTNTVHLNVAEVWKKYKGEGTYIAILEGNLNIIHPDLDDNIASDYNHNYDVNNTDANFLSHTIAVAGVAAARGYNGIGVRGVAPLAKMFILSNWEQDDDDHIAAMTIHREITAVSNNSYDWGFFRHLSSMWYLALETGIDKGFHGKGTVYVFSAGNQGNEGYNANYSPYTNYHAVITVCGVDYRGKHNDYSESGANLWVCAPSGGTYGIVTTDRPNTDSRSISNNRYTISTSGTSLSAPMVSGIVALMRQANKNLSWRDVKLILANSARNTDPDDKGWGQSGMKYGSFSERYYFNHKYGFGLVDAKAAVDLAEEWVNLPLREKDAVVKEEVNSTTPTISRSLIVKSDIDFIEHVDATIDFSIDQARDLSIELISPSGTTSTLASLGNNISNTLDVKYRFGSSRHLGEPASGEWRLIAQSVGKEKGKNIAERRLKIALRSWELRIRGYQVKLEAVATDNLSDLNVATDDLSDSPPLTLSLHGALWKEILEPSDFKLLLDATPGLAIAGVERTSSTQVQLKLEETGEPSAYYSFQVVATTGTVSNRATPLISNDVEVIIPPKLEVAAAADLSDINQTSLPLTLSLFRAHWKDTLKPSDFKLLLDATPGLAIAGVERTSSTQVQLNLEETGKPSAYYSFQVVATTGTVSNHSTPLISNDIEIARIAYDKEMYIPQVTKGFYYSFTAKNLLSSPTTLRYVIKVVQRVGEDETEMDLGELGFTQGPTQNGPIIRGTPTDTGDYYFKITATRQSDKISRTEYIAFDIQPPHTVRTQIKIYPEGLLSE